MDLSLDHDVFLVVDRFDDGLYVREAGLHETFDEVLGFLEDANDPQAVFLVNLETCRCADVSARFARAWWDEVLADLRYDEDADLDSAVPPFITAHCAAAARQVQGRDPWDQADGGHDPDAVPGPARI